MPNAHSLPDGIAVITIDRLPAWILPAYGSPWVSMPNLDALAGRGVVLDRLIATSDATNMTLQAMAPTAPTGPYDVDWNAAFVTDDDDICAPALAPIDVRQVPRTPATEPAKNASETNLVRLFGVAADAVASGKHQLVWCHASSLGATWDAPIDFRDRYLDPDDPPPPSGASVPEMTVGPETDPDILVGIRHVFAAQLTLLDRCIGHLVEAINGRRGRWAILVTGVRGLGLGLHGAVGGMPMPPYGELVHLPAIMVDHSERMAGQRYPGLVVPADLGATVADLLGHPSPPAVDPRQGRSLTRLLEAWQGPDRDRVITHGTSGISIATPAWHLVLPSADGRAEPQGQLFAKPDDYFELCDVANRSSVVADELSVLARSDPETAWNTPLSLEALRGA